MIAEYNDEREVKRYVTAVRKRVAAGALDRPAAAAAEAIGRGGTDPAAAILDAMPEQDPGPPSSGGERATAPFFSRDPTVSLLQSSLEDERRKRRSSLLARILEWIGRRLHPEKFGPEDLDWVTDVGAAMLDRLSRGNRPFNPRPAEHAIADDARIVIVGDWGSGLQHARDVARLMAGEVNDALLHGRKVHVVHLGDVYYSGDPGEYRRRVLAPGLWPVTSEQAQNGVTSWSLNGNHDMYSGGWGYFDTLLADGRFAAQHSPDGHPTSFFRLRSSKWDIVGLDTSWDSDVLSLGQKGVLHDPQAQVLKGWAGESDRRLMLLSHHQLVSSYDPGDLGNVLPDKLKPLLDSRRITASLWGHEHRCMGFKDSQGVAFPRCIGQGGIPVPGATVPDPPPEPGLWQVHGTYDAGGGKWNRFGFAVLDFAGDRVDIRYLDDQGRPAHTESIP
jgi:hypothetical protein